MSRGRAYTRHQRQRAWRRMWKIALGPWRMLGGYYPLKKEEVVKIVNTHYQNRHACSCPMCSYDRDLFGPPHQEEKQPDIEDFEEDLIES